MTEINLSAWIQQNLGPIIKESISASGHDLIFSPDLLGAMAQRETGFLMIRYITKNHAITPAELSQQMLGDWGQRPEDTAPRYHGYGFWQIDIKSFPDFINSGHWRDPRLCCDMAIKVLAGKRQYLKDKMPGLSGDGFERANVAAYNCGEGRVMKALIAHQDVDAYTFNKDYSREVWRFREMYKSSLPTA